MGSGVEMSEYDDLKRALGWHTDRAMEIVFELEEKWLLTAWWVRKGYLTCKPQV
jgi:hypothetical protein